MKRWMLVSALVLGFANAASAQNAYQREDDDFARFRFGVSGHGGALVNGPLIGMGGMSLRLGVQLGESFAIYYQPHGLVGSIVDRRTRGDSAAGLMFNSAMFEFIANDVFSIGAGPALDFIWGCSDDSQAGIELSCARSGPYFGMNGRLAVYLARQRGWVGPRSGLVLSADIHPTFFDRDNVGVTALAGIGFEAF